MLHLFVAFFYCVSFCCPRHSDKDQEKEERPEEVHDNE